VHSDVAALLAVQEDDVAIHDLESRLGELMPRLQAMSKERDQALAAMEQAAKDAAAEEQRRHEIAERIAQHRALQEKNQAALSNVSSMREATAATAQLEQARRMIEEDERELAVLGQRVVQANLLVEDRERTARELEEAQTQARATLDSDRAQLEEQIASARAVRDQKATKVPRSLLTRYDRIRSRKRVHAVYPLRGNACGFCDTAIPLQRRSMLTASGGTEVCEGCGVMLYAPD
jgi:predicted  nucleic acid-binding Zn-ribbon protein